MKRFTPIIIIACLFGGLSIQAQENAKIIIKKNINGEETVIEKEVEGDNMEEIKALLEEEGIDLELESSAKENRIIEIHIDKEEDGRSGHVFHNWSSSDEPSAFLGVSPNPGNMEGVRIAKVTEGSAAEEAGLLSGDLITSIDGNEIKGFEDLKAYISSKSPGDQVSIKYSRDGKNERTKADLGESKGHRTMHFNTDEDVDFEFDFDGMEEQMRVLKERHPEMPEREMVFKWYEGDEEGRMHSYSHGGHSMGEDRTVVFIMERISSEEAEQVNTAANPPLKTLDDLSLTELRFHPNPGDGHFELSFTTSVQGDLEVLIFDMQGKKVYYELLADFEGYYKNLIDISRRGAGNYFLQISQNGKTYSRKLIKE